MVCSTCATQRRALTSAIGGDLAMPAGSNQLYYSGRNLLRRHHFSEGRDGEAPGGCLPPRPNRTR